VVVLDISMPDMSGLEVLRVLKQLRPHLPVLMLSMHSGYHYVMGSLKAGASGPDQPGTIFRPEPVGSPHLLLELLQEGKHEEAMQLLSKGLTKTTPSDPT
jgi:CheY-like chemotaxis protein